MGEAAAVAKARRALLEGGLAAQPSTELDAEYLPLGGRCGCARVGGRLPTLSDSPVRPLVGPPAGHLLEQWTTSSSWC